MRIGSLIFISGDGDIGGDSSNTGFKVTRGNRIEKTINYAPSQNILERKNISEKRHFIIWWGLIWLFYAFLFLVPINLDKKSWLDIILSCLLAIISFFPALIITVAIFYRDIFGQDYIEYHACEHKVIALLSEKKLKPTIENLKKMPRVILFCGTNFIGLIAVMPLLFGILMTISALLQKFPGSIILISAQIASAALIIVLPCLLQSLFTTAEPKEEKLKEALEVAKKLCKSNELN